MTGKDIFEHVLWNVLTLAFPLNSYSVWEALIWGTLFLASQVDMHHDLRKETVSRDD